MLHDIALSFCYVLLQLVSSIGAIYVFGFIITAIWKMFYKNLGKYALSICYATGFIAVPIHELSHALFCVIFGHKINKIVLFKPDKQSQTLGYVNHSYNKKNPYQRIGNFFIGIAPIVVISAIIYLLTVFLFPALLDSSKYFVKSIYSRDLKTIKTSFKDMVWTFFYYRTDWKWYVYIILCVCLSLHMSLSKQDLEGSYSGLLLLIAAIFAINIWVFTYNGAPFFGGLEGVKDFTFTILKYLVPLYLVLTFSLVFLIFALCISFIFGLFIKGSSKNFNGKK